VGEIADLLEQMLSSEFTGVSECLLSKGRCPYLSEASGKTPIFPDVSLDDSQRKELQASVLCWSSAIVLKIFWH